MSASSHAQARFLQVPVQGAREVEAHRATGELLSRLAMLARGSQKALTPHSRTEFARELHSEDIEVNPSDRRHMHVFDLAFALQVLDAEDRQRLLEPLLMAQYKDPKPVHVEIAEVSEAAGEAVGFAARLLGEGACGYAPYTPRDLAELAARFHRLSREASDVPRAMAAAR